LDNPMIEEISDYIAVFPQRQRVQLERLYQLIATNVPDNTEERFSWKMPSFYLQGYVAHFSGSKNHIGLHIGSEGVKRFETKLTDFSCTKSTVHLSYDKPLPQELIIEIIKWRIKENIKQ